MIGAHLLGPAEDLGSSPAAIALFTELDIDLGLFGSDGRTGKGETGDDGMSNPAGCADAAQDPYRSGVIVFAVPGVFL
jgi:hypothetical protein